MLRINPYIGFDDRWFRVITIPVLSFCIPYVFFGLSPSAPWSEVWRNWATSASITIAYWTGVRAIVIAIRRRYPDFEQSRRRLWMQAIATLVYVFSLWPYCLFINRLFGVEKGNLVALVATNLTTLALFLAIYESIYFYDMLRRAVVERERMKQEQLLSQLEGLRNQVNPHFLFNSLNTLMNVVTEDPQLALRFLEKLSKVYRYVLEQRNNPLIPLVEELGFIQSYVFLQKERFGDSLQVDIQVGEAAKQMLVLPLSLQLLFENAIKHNVISKRKPLMIRVFEDGEGYLCVSNNLQRKLEVQPSTQVGLENVRVRYGFFSPKPVLVREGESDFTVALPLIAVQADS